MKKEQFSSKVHFLKKLDSETFMLRFDRNNVAFIPGQYVTISLKGERNKREYSICSSLHDDYFEIVVKNIPDGDLSPKLFALKTGDEIEVSGPFGFFVIYEKDLKRPFYFIGTGTGISPFLSFTASHQGLNYQLIYGIQHLKQYFFVDSFKPEQTVICTSKESFQERQGHVTNYMKRLAIEKDALFYLCGNSQMIEDMTDLLENRGIDSRNIRTERFF